MKNSYTVLGCFTVLALLITIISSVLLVKLDEANDRVAALEQRNNELQDELHSNTDAIYTEMASITDATILIDKDITDVTDDVEELKDKEEEREKEAEEEEKKKSETKTTTQTAKSTTTTYAEPEPTVEVAEETELTDSSDSSYLGSYTCTGYVATGNPCANGNYPTAGYTIASNSLPMGTRVYIEGIGERVVEDTGGMGSGVIDVFVSSVDEAYALTGTYEVYIIE